MKKLHQILDSITMYRVLLYALSFLVLITFVLRGLHIVVYSSLGVMALSLVLILTICYLSNTILSKVFDVAANQESTIITSLILFFVLAAPTNLKTWVGIGFAALIAVASKYVITWRRAHIFNPAAFGVLVVSVIGIGNGAWWIADRALFIPMVLVGIIVILKIRRVQLLLAFMIPALLIIITKTYDGNSITSTLITALTLYPVLFLGTIMLTEPSTMPVTQYKRLMFGAIVGVIFAANVDFGFIASSPHLALLLGNVFALLVTVRASTSMKLVEKKQLTPTTYSFAFKPDRPLHHRAGQYMEFTLPGIGFNSRGNRRTFTIASPPHTSLIEIGVKFYEKGSQFKSSLVDLRVGDRVIGNHVAGDFTLPRNPDVPAVFIAGGIGITPFIAMIEDVIYRDSKQVIDLYYFVADKSEIAFKEVLKTALGKGLNIHMRVGSGERLTEDDIKKHTSSMFYISGPPGLVGAYKTMLQKMKITKIYTDLFTGY
jgi:ferredoxin-NADP reductase/Na+-translocating ferredoxin:NAD+ oxidoreductase RnfD subunit